MSLSTATELHHETTVAAHQNVLSVGGKSSELTIGPRNRRTGTARSGGCEIAVDHCGLCHTDLSILNNEWGISRYPVVLGHEIVGRVTAVGPNSRGKQVGQREGVGANSGSCMHCR